MTLARIFRRPVKLGLVYLISVTAIIILACRHLLAGEHGEEGSETGTVSTLSKRAAAVTWIPAYLPRENKFNRPEEALRMLGYPLRKFITLDERNVEDFVLVTAANWAYYRISLDNIATAQRNFPNRNIIFYDLGSQDYGNYGRINMKEELSTLCNVEYREFPFSHFPDHVSQLKTYAWKPLIVHMVLQEHPGVVWMDSSVRFLSGNWSAVGHFVRRTDGVMLFNYAGHNTFTVTHPGMYSYLPTDTARLQKTFQFEANFMVFYRTYAVYNDVIKWWVLCALTFRCIAPTYDLACVFQGPSVYAQCHRFDQTAINILLANKFEFKHKNFARHLDGLESIQRYSSGREKTIVCPVIQ